MKFNLVLPAILVTTALALLFCAQVNIAQQPPRRIEITAKRFEFTPAEITLKKGEPVVLILKSIDVPHGVRFRGLGIETKVDKGKSSELPFTPDKLGDFVGHCAVFCGAGHGEMTLTLHIVE